MTLTPFEKMIAAHPTVLWNDSADPRELPQAIAWGAVGATCNPVIALTSLKSDPETWGYHIRKYAAENPNASEDEIGWAMVRKLSVDAAKLLEPTFNKYNGRNGRLSIQTDPRYYRDPQRLAKQAIEFAKLAENIIVKIPVTSAGVVAIEEATYHGVNINATVSFSVSQAIAVAEAIERGLNRRAAEGHDISRMGPVCTIMVGRTDDWMRKVADRDNIAIDPAAFDWAGVASFKRAYQIYMERGYQTRLLSAAFRTHMHWSELVGGDVVISPPFAWGAKLNEMDIEPVNRIDTPVDPEIIAELRKLGIEFEKAYEPDGMTHAQFDTYGATLRTLRQFLQANADLEAFVRDITLPNPDA